MDKLMTNEKWKQLWNLANEAWLDSHYAKDWDASNIFELAGRFAIRRFKEEEDMK